MSIEKSRLSLQTVAESRVDPVVAISMEEPPKTYLTRSPADRNVFIPVLQTALEVGQIAIVVNPDTKIPGMRCVVYDSITGRLKWVKVDMGDPASKFTGRAFDPKSGSIGAMGN